MQRLPSPTLVSAPAASEPCQTCAAAAAVPVQQQQHRPHGEHNSCIGVSSSQIKDSRQRSSTVPALRDSSCILPGDRACQAVIDTSSPEQSSVIPKDVKDVDYQQHPVGTDTHMLAGIAAHHDFEQVLMAQGCCLNAVSILNTLHVTITIRGPCSHSIAAL